MLSSLVWSVLTESTRRCKLKNEEKKKCSVTGVFCANEFHTVDGTLALIRIFQVDCTYTIVGVLSLSYSFFLSMSFTLSLIRTYSETNKRERGRKNRKKARAQVSSTRKKFSAVTAFTFKKLMREQSQHLPVDFSTRCKELFKCMPLYLYLFSSSSFSPSSSFRKGYHRHLHWGTICHLYQF